MVASPNQLLTVNFQLASTVLAVEIPFLKEIVFCYSEEFRYHLMLKKALEGKVMLIQFMKLG